MRKVNMHEAKSSLSELVRLVEEGEEVVLARNGMPVAKIVPVEPPGGTRVFGLREGISEDEDAMVAESLRPLSADELGDWLGPVDPTSEE